MRTRILLGILDTTTDRIVPRTELIKKMNLSESSIRNLVKLSNKIGEQNGFKIELLRGRGYYLAVTNLRKFREYLDETENLDGDVYNLNQRIHMMLFYIFQVKNYFTSEQIAERMNVSRATVVRDIEKIDAILSNKDLRLERKAHYGYKVIGDEKNIRRAFLEFVLNSELYLEPANDYSEFSKSFDIDNFKAVLIEQLHDNNLKMSDIALNNVINHVKILIFRALSNNYITNKQKKCVLEEAYHKISLKIATWINEEYKVCLPVAEIDLLAIHISGKASIEKISEQEKQGLISQIDEILQSLDEEFFTDFSHDNELKEALLLHMFPLLNRMYNNLKLENPLINEVYTQYANVFLVAFRFNEHIERKYGFRLSIDEIGYLTMHFATHFERAKKESIAQFKRIVVVCNTGGGSARLLELKLESVFPNALIVTSSVNELERFKREPPDLFLTTIPIDISFGEIPVIHIKQVLNENEISRIRDIASLKVYRQPISNSVLDLLELFSEKFFYHKVTMNYDKLIETLAKDLISEGYASQGFDQSVIEREKKFTTIYGNGVAGPHALKLEGSRDSISVAIYDKPLEWEGRIVQIVFLINLVPGHLFLYKEISKLLLHIMEDTASLEKLVNVKDFRQFKVELKKILK